MRTTNWIAYHTLPSGHIEVEAYTERDLAALAGSCPGWTFHPFEIGIDITWEKDKMTIILPSGFEIHGTPEQEKFLAARGAFVLRYCISKKWDHNNLTAEQVLEIKSQKGWKSPNLSDGN
jgi:hypothetical protein